MAIFRFPPPVFVGGHQPDAPKTTAPIVAPTPASATVSFQFTCSANATIPQAWNPARTSAQITLSNGNLTATIPTTGGANVTTFGVIPKTSGKYYWELVMTSPGGSGHLPGGGVGNIATTPSILFLGGTADTIAWYGTADVWSNNAQAATWAAFATGNLIGLALDLDNQKLWGRVGTTGNWNNDVIGNQNPATNIGGLALNSAVSASGGAVPAVDLYNTTDSMAAAFIAASWSGTAPSGFGPWVVSGTAANNASATAALQFSCSAFTDLKASAAAAIAFTASSAAQQFDQASATSALQFTCQAFTDLKASAAAAISFTTTASGQQFDQASAVSPIQFTCSAFTDLKARTTTPVLLFTTSSAAGQSDQAQSATPVLSFTCRAFTDLKANASAAILFTTAATGQQFDRASATSALLFTCSAAASTIPTIPQAWDPAHTAAQITLSNGNLTASIATSPGFDCATYGIVSKTSGKYYWEVVVTGNTTNAGAGVGNVGSTIGLFLGGEPSSLGWFGAGGVFGNGFQNDTWATFASGDRLCFALDLDNQRIWGRVGATGNWNNAAIGSQNPATNTGGLGLNAAVSAGFGAVPGGDVTHAGDQLDASFVAASWAGTAPSGFVAWPPTPNINSTHATAAIVFSASGIATQPNQASALIVFWPEGEFGSEFGGEFASGRRVIATATQGTLASSTSAITFSAAGNVSDWAVGLSNIVFSAQSAAGQRALASATDTLLTFNTVGQVSDWAVGLASANIQIAATAGQNDSVSVATPLLTFSVAGAVSDWSYGVSSLQFSAFGSIATVASATAKILDFQSVSTAVFGNPVSAHTPLLTFNANGQVSDWAFAAAAVTFSTNASLGQRDQVSATTPLLTFSAAGAVSDAATASAALNFTCAATALRSQVATAVSTAPVFTTAATLGQSDPVAAAANINFSAAAVSGQANPVTAVSALQFGVVATAGLLDLATASANINLAAAGSALQKDPAAATVQINLAAVGVVTPATALATSASINFSSHATVTCSTNASAVNNVTFGVHAVSSGIPTSAIITWPPITARGTLGVFATGSSHLVYFDEDDRHVYFGGRNERAYSLLPTRRAA